MDVPNAALNLTVVAKVQKLSTIITEEQHRVIMIVNCVFLSTLVSMFGIVTNMINLVVFCKQGLNSSINVSFFALAIADLSSLLLQLCNTIYLNPWFQQTDWLIAPFEFHLLASGLPREAFIRDSCMITVYITMERCLCIMFPLHVKRVITPRRTAVSMAVIYLFTLLCAIPIGSSSRLGWKFYPERNKTLLGVIVSPLYDTMWKTTYMYMVLMGIILLLAAVMFTTILIRKLTNKSKWRQSAKGDKSMSTRDRETGNMVALIAVVLIVSNFPTAFLSIATFVEPEFNHSGCYSNVYFAAWSFAFLLQTSNASSNIFLYFKMSAKFRKTFHALFTCRYK